MAEIENNRLKEELLENVSELFLKYGLRSTSMEDICSHLKISKKTLYQFFGNKDDLVEQVMLHRRHNHRTQKDMEEMLQLDSIDLLISLRDHIIVSFNSQMPANLFDMKKYHPEVYKRINEQDQLFITELLNGTIDRGIKTGDFRPDIDKELQVYLFVKQMSQLSEPEMLSEIKYPVGLIITAIIGNMLRSFVTRQGMGKLENLTCKAERKRKDWES